MHCNPRPFPHRKMNQVLKTRFSHFLIAVPRGCLNLVHSMVLTTTKILLMECKQQTPVWYFETWWFMPHGSWLQTEHSVLRLRFDLLNKDAGKEILKFPFSAFLLIFLEKGHKQKSQGARSHTTDQTRSANVPSPALFALFPTRAFSPQQLLHHDATRRHKTIHVETEVWFLKPC